MRGRWHGPWCIEDIGTVTYPCEKMEGGCMTVDMCAFLYWINLHPLADLQLAGASFMWSNTKTLPLYLDWIDFSCLVIRLIYT